MCSSRTTVLVVILLALAGCGDNLMPSGEDRRLRVEAGSTGSAVGQKAADFLLPDTTGTTLSLTSALTGKKAAVFYFTMWCPICDSHMSHLRTNIMPAFPGSSFFLVDYVSGSAVNAAASASASGYSGMVTLADTGHTLLSSFQATMGTTVVVDNGGIIRMNEDYRDGSRLQAVLTALP